MNCHTSTKIVFLYQCNQCSFLPDHHRSTNYHKQSCRNRKYQHVSTCLWCIRHFQNRCIFNIHCLYFPSVFDCQLYRLWFITVIFSLHLNLQTGILYLLPNNNLLFINTSASNNLFNLLPILITPYN